MQFIDLAAQQSRIRDNIEERIKRVLDHGRYIMGPEITELENMLADFCNVKYGVAVGSGTDALLMALMAWDIKPGDAVFTTPFTFIATAEVIRLLGATPVFVDIQEDTYNIDPNDLEIKIEDIKKNSDLNPKGIIPVDLFGQSADYDEIKIIAEKHNLFILEDAAQSFGATYKGRRTCSFGDAAATSFFPAKPLGCYGDGGMIFTDNEDFHKTLISIRNHGQGDHRYDNVRVGLNGRMDSIQAAILIEKMSLFSEELVLRQEKADFYSDNLKDCLKTPAVREYNTSAWAQYSLLTEEREKVQTALKNADIPSAVYYPKPLHLQDAFKEMDYKYGDFPVTEKMAESIFSIPMHPYLKEEDQKKIISVIKETLGA